MGCHFTQDVYARVTYILYCNSSKLQQPEHILQTQKQQNVIFYIKGYLLSICGYSVDLCSILNQSLPVLLDILNEQGVIKRLKANITLAPI